MSLKNICSLFHFSILSMSPCFPVPLSLAESLSFFYLTLAIYHYMDSEQVAMQRKGTDGSSMSTALRNRRWSVDSALLWYECWVVSVRSACWTMMRGCHHALHPYFHFHGICFLTTLTYNLHCFADIFRFFGLWKNGHSGHRTQPYRDLFNKLDKQLQTEAFDIYSAITAFNCSNNIWHRWGFTEIARMICDSLGHQ